MNVLVAVPLYPPESNVGAWLATHECARHLAKRGHKVRVVTTHINRPTYYWDGIEVSGAAKHRYDLYQWADVIVAHLHGVDKPAREARRLSKPLVWMVHGIHGAEKAKIGQFGPPALVVYPSQATATEVGWEGPQIVVHPPLDPDDYRVKRTGTEVVLVNLMAEKGGALFWKLADALPHLGFLGVRGGYGAQIVRTRPNVAVMPHVADMKRVYRRTRVLLMPSETETWGRVGVEAAVSGIPIIAHPSPGLQEALGDAATWLDRADLGAWVEQIRILGMPGAYKAAVRRSQARSRDLDPLPELERFATHLEALCVRS